MSILHQNHVTQSLHNLISADKIHNALFFYGPSSVGKLTTALALVLYSLCENTTPTSHTNQNLTSCHKCKPCLQFLNFQHPSLTLISTRDRITKLNFLQKILIEQSGNHQTIIAQILLELKHLIYRHKKSYLNLLPQKKYSYPEGEVLKKSELEAFYNDIYLKIETLEKQTDISWVLSKNFIKDVKKLQNVLDRTVITKEKIEQAIRWGKTQYKNKKWIVIDNVELIHPSVIGAFLKTLEEPDPDTYFILIKQGLVEKKSLNDQTILPLLSRCLKFKFRSLEGNVPNILQRQFAYHPENTQLNYIDTESSMNQAFTHILTNVSNHPLQHFKQLQQQLSQPMYKVATGLERDSFLMKNYLRSLKIILETYLNSVENENYKDLSKKKSAKLPFKMKYSDCLFLMKHIKECEDNLEKGHFNTKSQLFYFLSFLKKRNIFPTTHSNI